MACTTLAFATKTVPLHLLDLKSQLNSSVSSERLWGSWVLMLGAAFKHGTI
jgi:hypothetical protein